MRKFLLGSLLLLTLVAGAAPAAQRATGRALINPFVPRGAVMAFNLQQCPRGWHDFAVAAGRTVVGVGSGAGLTPRTLGQTGGKEAHALTVQEMPSHSHAGNVSTSGHSYEHHQFNGRMPGENWQRNSGATGGNQPHPTMPPFIALRYCEKE